MDNITIQIIKNKIKILTIRHHKLQNDKMLIYSLCKQIELLNDILKESDQYQINVIKQSIAHQRNRKPNWEI